MTISSKKKQQIKRYRDTLSPKPILDRPALLKDLKSAGIFLKNVDITLDLFYQLLHRRGYPPLDEFVAELYGSSSSNGKGDDISVTSSSTNTNSNITTKNAISNRNNKLPQLPKQFLSYLSTNISNYQTVTSKILSSQTSSNGTTTKLAIQLQDEHVVESVLMRHESRITICISSQVGCAMGCTFCATGTMGIRGNLCSGEILEQLVHGSRVLLQDDNEKDTKPETKKKKALIRNVVVSDNTIAIIYMYGCMYLTIRAYCFFSVYGYGRTTQQLSKCLDDMSCIDQSQVVELGIQSCYCQYCRCSIEDESLDKRFTRG